jgi:hypothetical protein
MFRVRKTALNDVTFTLPDFAFSSFSEISVPVFVIVLETLAQNIGRIFQSKLGMHRMPIWPDIWLI